MSKYRFKTKEEFIQDGLWRENHPCLWNSRGKMNKYLGQDIPEEFNDECSKGVEFHYEDWTFYPNNYVLKETSVDMKAIQEEAKKRFPIGCKFKNTNGGIYTLQRDDAVYKIHVTSIWAHDSCGCLYDDGKWAELISLPESVSIDEFIPSTKEAYEAQLLPKKDAIKNSESPLEICRQKYKKGMVVQSAQESGVYSGTFTINANPEEFYITGDGIDYFGSEGFLYYRGKYAEILIYPDEQSKIKYSNSENNVLNKITIQKETFIENVQSVDINLVVKKKRIIF